MSDGSWRSGRYLAELRRSNAAGLHQDKRERRCRTRTAQVRKSVKDWEE